MRNYFILMVLGIVLFQVGCKKDDIIKPELSSRQLKFFTTTLAEVGLKNDTIEYISELRSADFNSHLAEIQNAMVEMDQKFNIVDRITINYGFPIWRVPLKADNLHSNIYSYCFPIVVPNKKWTNGYIRILKNSDGELRFYIVREKEILERLLDGYLTDEDIENIGIKNHFDYLIYSSTNPEIEQSLFDLILSQNQRVKFRSGCFDDYVVETHTQNSIYQTQSSNTGWWMLVLNGVSQPQTAQPAKYPGISMSPKVFTTMVLTAVDPDCGGNTNTDGWISGGSNGGVVINPHVYWENKTVNSIFLNACKNRASNTIEEDDDYSQLGGSYSWSQEDVNKCNKIRALTECGVNDENIIRYLAALEAGFIEDNQKANRINTDFCNNPVLNDAMNNYFDCLERFSLTSQKNDDSGVAPFYTYLEKYIVLNQFLANHNNDQISSILATTEMEYLCYPNSKTEINKNISLQELEGYYSYAKNVEVVGDPAKKINLWYLLANCFGLPNNDGDYIDCRNFTGKLSFTIYVDQPIPNTRANYKFPDDVGHTFISLSMSKDGIERNVTFGFYPEGNVVPLLHPGSSGQIQDDSGHHFDVSYTIDVTCSDFNKLLKAASSNSIPSYHLNNYNCSDYALQLSCIIFENCQGGIPDTHGEFPGGGGTNPGDLGEDIKAFVGGGILNSNGGIAPEINCN